MTLHDPRTLARDTPATLDDARLMAEIHEVQMQISNLLPTSDTKVGDTLLVTALCGQCSLQHHGSIMFPEGLSINPDARAKIMRSVGRQIARNDLTAQTVIFLHQIDDTELVVVGRNLHGTYRCLRLELLYGHVRVPYVHELSGDEYDKACYDSHLSFFFRGGLDEYLSFSAGARVRKIGVAQYWPGRTKECNHEDWRN